MGVMYSSKSLGLLSKVYKVHQAQDLFQSYTLLLYILIHLQIMTSFKPLAGTALFKPLQVGSMKLEHRIVLAPLTRMRATKESDGVYVANELLVEHYSQRASKGGLLLTEATPISRLAAGYPGVFLMRSLWTYDQY